MTEKTPLQLLTEDLSYRQGFLEKRNSAYFIKEYDAKELIEFTYMHLLMGIERKATLADIATLMGNRIRQKNKLKKDTLKSVQAGWFILVSYFEVGILSYYCAKVTGRGSKKGKHTTYQIKVKNWEAFNNLITLVDENKCDMFPVKEPVDPWENTIYHKQTGRPLIRNAHTYALKKVKDTDLSYLTDTLNKLNNTGWRINKYVLEVYQKCMESDASPFKFTKETDPERRASLMVETKAVEKMAERNKDNTFYHLYNCDFRGRIYPNTAFLHEQASDNAKGLLLLDEPVPLGEHGFKWLCIHAANMLGQDKLELHERVEYIQNLMNDNEILRIVSDPMKNNSWMQADKPFCYLAACKELDMLDSWVMSGNHPYDFPSCLPLYIDGSNNGVQHLTAMSLDETVAPLVNLVPQKLPGDVYMFIADKVIERVKKMATALPIEDRLDFDDFYDEIKRLKREIEKWQAGTEKFKLAVDEYRKFKNHKYDYNLRIWPEFWNRLKDRKKWRKTVKRPVMTLGYGGTQFGMAEQVIDDTRSLSEYLRDKEDLWAIKLGHLIYKTCYEELAGPARMLKMFTDLAERENGKDRPITYSVPVTNFPFVHKYREGRVARADLRYGDEMLKIRLTLWEDSTLKKSKQKSGTAPNIVHSVDALHLTICVHDAPYVMTVVHDSFGCHAGNMQHLFKHVREKFVELYELQPLELIMDQMESKDLIPKKGNLDIRQVINSDFAFA